jgi:hypothetical protein
MSKTIMRTKKCQNKWNFWEIEGWNVEIGAPQDFGMNQALQSLIIKIKGNEGWYSLEIELIWLNFL